MLVEEWLSGGSMDGRCCLTSGGTGVMLSSLVKSREAHRGGLQHLDQKPCQRLGWKPN